MKTTKELLGSRIKELRKAKKLTQEELAELIGVEPQHMSRLEIGKSYPSLDRLEKMAIALDVQLRDFFEYMHLEDTAERVDNLLELTKELSEEQQKIVYKLVQILKESQ